MNKKLTPYDLYLQLMEMHNRIDPIAYPTKRISKMYFHDKLLQETLCELKDDDGNLIGIGLYYINNKNMSITTFVIDLKHRKKGYGTKLLNNMIDIAKKKKCKSMSLRVSTHNKNAHNFYMDSGFIDASITMYKELKDD